MIRTRSWAVLGLLLLLGCAPAPPADDAQLLAEVTDGWWRYLLAHDVYLQVKYGEPIERLPELSLARARERSEVARRHLERLAAVDAERLSHEGRVELECLRWDFGLEAERARHYWLEFPHTPRSVRNDMVPDVLEAVDVAEAPERERFLRLLRLIPGYVTAVRTKLEGQVERGIVVPAAELDVVVSTWRPFAATGEASPFHVAPERLAGVDPEAAADFTAAAERLVAEEVTPALTAFVDYLTGAYAERAPATVGRGQYPGGAEHYRFLVRFFATVDTPPKELHARGVERVAALTAEMDAVRRATGFAGSREEFHHFLETDPRFLAATPEEMASRLAAYLEKIEPRLDDYFLRRPAAPYALRRLPPELEGGISFGYYRPPTASDPTGTYFYNASHLDQRPLFDAGTLIYHELVPGHHFQVSLQDENQALSIYRQNAFYSAYAEGWAVYASELAREMGMYDDDPYALYGRLAEEMRFAVRLVVDTGLNALGWSRERALEYMQAHVLGTETQLVPEILRYGTDIPGQALAYRVGSEKIWELRRRAEERLGERFDVRRFHDAVLGYGPMPLAVLEEHVERFIAEEASR